MSKRLTPLVVLLVLAGLFVSGASAAPVEAVAADKSPGAPLAGAVSAVTGMAISPLLGTGGYGAYLYVTAKDETARAALPWFAQLSFWLPALVIVGACAAKDALGAALPPGWKKPLDVLETVENKATGLLAAGAVVPFTMASLSKMLVAQGPAVAPHLMPSGLAAIQVAAIDFSWLLNLLTVPFGVAVFALVWMASHAINALILVSPWGAIDAALKGARTALLGLVTLAATINPWVGAGLSLIVIVLAYFLAGWAFRLNVFAAVFCWDFVSGKRKRFAPTAAGSPMFSGSKLTKAGVPVRSLGVLRNEPENGRLVFSYKPWLVLPVREVAVETAAPCVGRGLFFSTIDDGERTVMILPPRYRGHEETLVRVMEIEGGVKPAGLIKAWGALRDLFSGTASRTQAA